MTKISLTIIIPTCGRESLTKALESVLAAGIRPDDQIIVVGDGPQPVAARIVRAFRELPIDYYEHGPTRMVGAAQRQFAMGKAKGDYLCFLDDDDIYLPEALEAVRSEILKAPGRPLVFKERSCVARHPWGVVWKNPAILCGNVGTQGIVVPNNPSRLGYWDNCYSSDYTFLRTTVDRYPNRDADVVWVDRIIAELH